MGVFTMFGAVLERLGQGGGGWGVRGLGMSWLGFGL